VLELVPAGTSVITLTAENPDYGAEHCSLGGTCYLGTVYTSTVATVTVVLRVDAGYEGDSVVNTASVSADQADTDVGDNVDSVTTEVTQSADLTLGKVGMPDPVLAGEVLLYQLTVSNTGPSDAVGVVVTDTVPVSTTFAGASPACVESGGVVTCALGTLGAGERASVWIEVRVDAGVAGGTILTNSAGVSSDTTDPDPTDDTTSEETTVYQAAGNPTDLAIGKVAWPDPVVAGEVLTYTLVVTNEGPAEAEHGTRRWSASRTPAVNRTEAKDGRRSTHWAGRGWSAQTPQYGISQAANASAPLTGRGTAMARQRIW